MEAVSRLELLVAGSSQNARQSRVCRSYQILATIATGVPVVENWKRVSKFREDTRGACGPRTACTLPQFNARWSRGILEAFK